MPALPTGRGGGTGGRGNATAAALNHVYAAARNQTLTIAPPGLLPPPSASQNAALSAVASLVTLPAHGTVTVKPDGSFAYTPQRGYVGQDAFTYRTATGSATTEPGNVTVVVR
jgi:hypothetical protein